MSKSKAEQKKIKPKYWIFYSYMQLNLEGDFSLYWSIYSTHYSQMSLKVFLQQQYYMLEKNIFDIYSSECYA